MAIRVGINGYGRIGRNVLRALFESGRTDEIEIAAVNDLGDAETNAHLTRYDRAHGPFPGTIEVKDGAMIVNGRSIKVLSERDPAKLPWGDLGVDVVHESTGLFANKTKAAAHLEGGAEKVVISAPAGTDIDATIVYGVNHQVLKSTDTVISNALAYSLRAYASALPSKQAPATFGTATSDSTGWSSASTASAHRLPVAISLNISALPPTTTQH